MPLLRRPLFPAELFSSEKRFDKNETGNGDGQITLQLLLPDEVV
jgi:hypothetical protein